jgi:ribonuclease HI
MELKLVNSTSTEEKAASADQPKPMLLCEDIAE